ncbi:hypothetical protein [Pseudomonas sp. HS6]|uniref:hypothetical protein n=1 Tax=Pseudomonas sp. HS6 TaxID=2850559 RepID=UPI002019E334|nr:hypothetical protein [Pseudomonas sp. HS6]UQS16693.1 hypothetical protein JJN09_07515 [Pseudomonas sp. HS6]
MVALNSYTDPTEALNQSILKLAPKERPSGIATILHFSSCAKFDAKPLTLTTGQYPFTGLGSIGTSYVDSAGDEWAYIRQQFKNRHGLTTLSANVDRADQLVLLDSLDSVQIKEAVARDRQYTGGSILVPDAVSAFGTNHAITTYAAEQVIARRLALGQQPPDPTAMNYWNLLGSDPIAQAKVGDWLQNYGYVSDKFAKHDVKSGDRLKNHLQNLENSNAQHFGSETRGEYAAAKLLITVLGQDYQMKLGKSSAGRINGIDQIWVKRNLWSGEVEQYIIVECKGSMDAKLGEASYGWQMSTAWVFYALIGLLGTDGSLASKSLTDVFAQKSMVKKILDALINPGPPTVKGLLIQPMTKSVTTANAVEMIDLGAYSLVQQYLNATQSVGRFDNAPIYTGNMLS